MSVVNQYFRDLYLLFVARQGYLNDVNKISKFYSFWVYVYKYLISSVFLILILPFSKENLYLLKNIQILDWFNCLDVLKVFIYLIIPLGVGYENYFTKKTNTESTLRIFFNVSKFKYHFLLVIRNLIIISPGIILAFLFKPLIFLVLTILIHISSLVFFSYFLDKGKIFNTKRFRYILSVVDLLSMIKIFFAPIFSVFLFIIIESFFPRYLYINLNSVDSLVLNGVILGSIFFSSRCFCKVFLSINNDLPYLHAIGINLDRFLSKILFGGMLVQFIITMIPFWIFYFSKYITGIQILTFSLSLLATFLAIQGIQMREATYFKDKQIKTVRELELYKFPLGSLLKMWFLRLLIPISFIFYNQLNIKLNYFALTIDVLLIVSFIYNYSFVMKEFTYSYNGENLNVTFIN